MSIVVIVPSAIYFLLNQREQLQSLKESSHRDAIDRYREFLSLCIAYPNLSLETGRPRADLTAAERLQRDILFDMLTASFERAFIIYADRRRSFRASQWRGWEAYIDGYLERPDYLEWWRRSVFDDDPRNFFKPESSQYDRRFERYIFERMKPSFQNRSSDGSLDRFAMPNA